MCKYVYQTVLLIRWLLHAEKFHMKVCMAAATIMVLLLFPLHGLYRLCMESRASIHLVDGWLLLVNNAYLHLYLTAVYLFLIAGLPFYTGKEAPIFMRCSRKSAYYAPLWTAKILAYLVVCFAFILNLLFSIPVGYIQNLWSDPMRWLGNADIQIAYKVFFTPPLSLVDVMTPWLAALFSVCVLLLFWDILAKLMFLMGTYGRRRLGVVAAIGLLFSGWMILLFGDIPILNTLSPMHHSLIGFAYQSGYPDFTPIGMLLYLAAINGILHTLCTARLEKGLECVLMISAPAGGLKYK